jgi:hypothetical protein
MRTKLGLVAACAIASACTSFASAETDGDAGALPTAEAGAEASSGDATDAARVDAPPQTEATPLACDVPLERPLDEPFDEPFNATARGWSLFPPVDGSVSVKPAFAGVQANGASGSFLVATTTAVGKPNPATIGHVVATKARSARLEFMFAYTQMSPAAELGCSLSLFRPSTPMAEVRIAFSTTTKVKSGMTADGAYYVEGAGQAGYFSETEVARPAAGAWTRVASEIVVEPTGDIALSMTVNGVKSTVPTAGVPYAFESLRVRCGIFYVSGSAAVTNTVALDQLHLTVCPSR